MGEMRSFLRETRLRMEQELWGQSSSACMYLQSLALLARRYTTAMLGAQTILVADSLSACLRRRVSRAVPPAPRSLSNIQHTPSSHAETF